MHIILLVLLAAGYLVAQEAPQGRGGAAAPSNLQALPRTTTQQELQTLMQSFNTALGVQCNHCHVTADDAPRGGAARGPANAGAGGRGRGGAAAVNDYPSDNKPQKRVARTMISMTRDINAKLGAELGKAPDTVAKVECITCHRGAVVPSLTLASTAP